MALAIALVVLGAVGGARRAAASGAVLEVPKQVATLQQAIAEVGDGGVIELAAGTYAAPAAGWKIGNAHKSFTIRAALGAAVALDGGGTHPVLVLRNSAVAHGGLVVFEHLTFRNGGGGSPTTSPGVTVDAGQARFVGCAFTGNAGSAGADGGGVKVRNGSTAAFLGCTFSGNSSPVAGGAMMVDDSTVQVTGGAFTGNQVNLAGAEAAAQGGAISAVDSAVAVSDALFQGNQASWVGGAIYAIGTRTADPAVPHTTVSVTRCTFQDNAVAPQACCPPPGVTTGGAIHVEAQAALSVGGASFAGNQAQFGGAIDSFGAQVSVVGSTFVGNGGSVTAADQAVGGAICALAASSAADGGQLPPPMAVSVASSLLAGGAVVGGGGGLAANAGGCILADGDTADLYGEGVPQQGTPATDRASLAVSGSVLAGCAAQQGPASGGGTGGAISGSLLALTLGGSLVLDSSASGSDGLGGGIFLNQESDAQIVQSIFAGNAASTSGGGIYAGASNVAVSGSAFVANQVGTGAGEPVNQSRGAALFFLPSQPGQPHAGSGDASGTVAQSTFSADAGLAVWDLDALGPGPINTMQYAGNRFFETVYGGRVYTDTVADPGRGGLTVAALDGLVVPHAGAPATVKSPVGNVALAAPPAAGSLVAFPGVGSPGARSVPFLAYGWTGQFATLNGAPLPQHGGVIAGAAAGSYQLAVNGAPAASAELPAVQCTGAPFLCLASDRFRVQVQWTLPSGESGDGQPVALSDDTGYFWFFDPAAVELVVKMVDGRALNGCFWIFYGALSNVSYTLTVTDTVTGAVNAYVNPPGQLASVADTTAFLGTGNAPPAPPVTGPPPPPPPPAACGAGPTALCLEDRFRVTVSWRTTTGATGSGSAVPLTVDTGYLWFFDAAEVDLVVKILDGSSINGYFWVFYGALSNVQYTIKVTDTRTGDTKTYINQQGTLASVADTTALRGP